MGCSRCDDEHVIVGVSELKLLGTGGFGRVYRARHGGAEVAVKIARDDRPFASERLAREAEALAAIGPPHVPGLVEHGRLEDGTAYVIMELVRAPTLAARLAAGERPDVATVGPALLRALDAAHARGIAHRDLKPGNVFWDGASARLCDFGLARAAAELSPSLTREGEIVGTPEYMSPEQCAGRSADERADVYAAGVMLYELLAGKRPFEGGAGEVQRAHLHRRPERLVGVAPAVEQVVLRCLAKEPERRFASAGAALAALEGALAAPAVAATTSAPAARGHARERRTVAVVLASGAEPLVVQETAKRFGGRLAHAGDRRALTVFDHDAGEDPVGQALAAADTMLARAACERALLDVRAVSVLVRPDGARRYVDASFTDESTYPRASDPRGVLLTAAAALALPDVATTPARDGLVVAPRRPRGGMTQLLGGSLVGRDELVRTLADCARRARGAVPAAAAVFGEAGHGKTHLARELVRRLEREVDVVELRVRGDAGVDPDETLRELLRVALRLPASRPEGDGRELLLAQLGPDGERLWPGVAQALGWIDAAHPEVRHLAAAPGALRAAAARAAGEGLRRRATRRPLALFLDDAHRADEATLDALELATIAEAGASIFVCVLGRGALRERRPAWGERAAERVTVDLGALDDAAAAELCRRLLLPAEEVPDAAVAKLVWRAQGVPLLLVELVRGVKRQGLVRRHARGHAWYLATDEIDQLPDLPVVSWVAARELDALPPELAAHARLASLLGPELRVSEIEAVVTRLEAAGAARDLPLDAGAALARLEAAGLLVRNRHGSHVFRHALVREAVAGLVPPATRVRVHAAAYELFRERASDDLARLALHATAAGMVAEARTACLALAERAHARHAYVEAEALYTRALDLECDRASTLQAHRGRGLVRYRIGRYDDARGDLERARALAAGDGDDETVADILLDEATLLDWSEDYRRSQAAVEEAARLGAASRPVQAARLLLGQGRSAHRFSRSDEASALLERAAAAAEKLGDDGYETWAIAMLMLGFVLPATGRLAEGEAALERVIEACRARGDRVHLFSALNNRALVRGYRGATGELVVELEAIRELARELGQITMELVAEFNLGEFLYLMGDAPAAMPHVRRATELERRRHGDAARPVVAALEARVACWLGDLATARKILDGVAARVGEARARGQLESLPVPAEEVLLDMVALATRGAPEAEWRTLEERAARFSVGQERIEVHELHAVTAKRAGRIAEARAALAEARRLAASVPNVMDERLRRLEATLSAPALAVTPIQ